MADSATQFDMFPALPRQTVAADVRADWNEFRRAQERLGGLVPSTHAAALLGVSRQRMEQLVRKGAVRSLKGGSFRYVSVADLHDRLANPVPGGYQGHRKNRR